MPHHLLYCELEILKDFKVIHASSTNFLHYCDIQSRKLQAVASDKIFEALKTETATNN